MAAVADATLRDLIRISSIGGDDERILTFGDPPLDHIEEDDDSYEVDAEPSSSTPPPPLPNLSGRMFYGFHAPLLPTGNMTEATSMENKKEFNLHCPSRRGIGPVDVDAIDGMSVSLDSAQGTHCFDAIASVHETCNRRRPSEPVDLDETVLDDEDESTVLENFLPLPVDMDSVQDREEDFSMIWKEHEDEFLVWKDNERHHMLALKRARANKGHSLGKSCRVSDKKLSRHVKNDKYVAEGGQHLVRSATIVLNYCEKEEDCKHRDSLSVCSRSLDSFGFSLMQASVDSYGFSLKGSSPLPKHPNHPATFRTSKDTASVSSGPSKVLSIEDSRGQTMQHITDILGKDPNIEDMSSVQGLGAEARGLRALRLRSANYKRTQRVEPFFSTVHENEELSASTKADNAPPALRRSNKALMESTIEEQKESFAAFDYPSSYGLMVKIQDDIEDAEHSVVSDITNLSDKIFLRVKTPESKWDDISSVGLNGVEGRPSAKDDDVIYAKELSPTQQDVEVPPVYFDASVKTPPFLSNHDMLEDVMANHDDDPESTWDEISSIGLLGVEGLRKVDLLAATPGEVYVPSGIASQNVYFVQSGAPHNASSHTGRRSVKKPLKEEDIFRPYKKGNAAMQTPDIAMNPTFSTVWSEDSGTSNVTGDFPDPEMQKEVSSTSETSVEDAKLSLDTRRFTLTPRDWVIIAAILLVTISAIAIMVFFVYANL
jgi:hypothetical protein